MNIDEKTQRVIDRLHSLRLYTAFTDISTAEAQRRIADELEAIAAEMQRQEAK
jgi:hypothetical protein